MTTDPGKTVFIYALKEPDTGEIRYIGKAEDVNKRYANHFADRETNHRTNWIKSLVARGLKPDLEILDEVPEEYWRQWEVAWIEYFRESGAKLVNGTAGGDGVWDPSGETSRKISRALTGNSPSQETREKISNALLGNVPWNKGKQASISCRSSMIEGWRRRRERLGIGPRRPPEAKTEEQLEQIRARNLEQICALQKRNADARRGTKLRAGTSSFVGVCWNRRESVWVVRASVFGERLYAGKYDSEVDAAHVYDWVVRLYFRDSARVNFP